MEALDPKTGVNILAAAGDPDEGVDMPAPGAPRDPASFTTQVSNLKVGDTVMRSITLLGDGKHAKSEGGYRAVGVRLRNSVAPAITVAKQRTGGKFSVEVFLSVAPSGRLFCIAAVTRTE